MIAILTAAYFSFQGGNLGDLTRSTARWFGKPTVTLIQAERARAAGGPQMSASEIAAYKKQFGVAIKPLGSDWKPTSQIKPFQIDGNAVGNSKDFVRLMKVKSQISASMDSGIALWQEAWEPTTTFVQGGGMQLPSEWVQANSKLLVLQSDRLSCELPANQAVSVKSIADLKWSKPVKVHWLLEQMWVVPSLKSTSELDTLKTLAKAICGRVTQEGDKYSIDIDYKEFRERAAASIEVQRSREMAKAGGLPKTEINVSATGFDLSRATWRWLSDADLAELFSSPKRLIVRDIATGTQTSIAMSRYIDAYRAWAADPPQGKESTSIMMRKLLSKVDWKQPPRILIGQNLGVSPGCQALGGGTVLL